MEDIHLRTNNLAFFYDMGLDKGNFALWVISEMPKPDKLALLIDQLGDPRQFKKVFLISYDGDLLGIRDCLPDNYHCWDSVIYDNPIEKFNTYLFWAEYLVRVNQHIDAVQLIRDPLASGHPPTKLFECLLGRKRPHRDFVNRCVHQSNFAQRMIFNYFDGQNQSWLSGSSLDCDPCLDVSTESYGAVGVPMRLDQIDNSEYFVKYNNDYRTTLSVLLPWKIYNDSWFSIVADTEWDYRPDRRFPEVNEKILKPLLGKRLFVYFGPCYGLRRLKSIGFKTFDSVLDESYDSCTDDQTRWQQAWHQVESLAQQDPMVIYEKILPVLEHNQRLMLHTNWRQNLVEQVRCIADIVS